MMSFSNAVRRVSLEQQLSHLPGSCLPVDVSCHSKVSNLSHSAGAGAAQQTVTGGDVSVEETERPL